MIWITLAYLVVAFAVIYVLVEYPPITRLVLGVFWFPVLVLVVVIVAIDFLMDRWAE